MVQWFVCLSVAMATSQGKGYGTQSIRGGQTLSGLREEHKAAPNPHVIHGQS